MPLAAAAAVLTLCGWAVLHHAFTDESEPPQPTDWMGASADDPWDAMTGMVPIEPNRPGSAGFSDAVRESTLPTTATGQPGNPLLGTWTQFSRPVWELFRIEVSVEGLACLLLCGLWALAIWAFVGGAISRMAAVQLACEEQVGLVAALRYACSKWRSYFSAPLIPLLGIVVVGMPVWVLGLLMRSDFGVLLTALVWPLAIIAGLIMAVLLLGLLFGWPLMFATISAEGTDSFDALSRCYAYTFGRPLRYLCYALVAAVFGALCWLLVQMFAAGVVHLPYWAAGWAAGSERIESIATESEDTDDPEAADENDDDAASDDSPSGVFTAGRAVIRFFGGCVALLAVGFFYAYFWVASTAIYFLLRHDVDATEMDEVFLDEDASEEEFGLPALATDEAGAPVVEEGEDEGVTG